MKTETPFNTHVLLECCLRFTFCFQELRREPSTRWIFNRTPTESMNEAKSYSQDTMTVTLNLNPNFNSMEKIPVNKDALL